LAATELETIGEGEGEERTDDARSRRLGEVDEWGKDGDEEEEAVSGDSYGRRTFKLS